ncbi:hypothetical protein ACVWW4_000103 [Bradyrhizobium sp. LB7.1]
MGTKSGLLRLISILRKYYRTTKVEVPQCRPRDSEILREEAGIRIFCCASTADTDDCAEGCIGPCCWDRSERVVGLLQRCDRRNLQAEGTSGYPYLEGHDCMHHVHSCSAITTKMAARQEQIARFSRTVRHGRRIYLCWGMQLWPGADLLTVHALASSRVTRPKYLSFGDGTSRARTCTATFLQYVPNRTPGGHATAPSSASKGQIPDTCLLATKGRCRLKV